MLHIATIAILFCFWIAYCHNGSTVSHFHTAIVVNDPPATHMTFDYFCFVCEWHQNLAFNSENYELLEWRRASHKLQEKQHLQYYSELTLNKVLPPFFLGIFCKSFTPSSGNGLKHLFTNPVHWPFHFGGKLSRMRSAEWRK